MIILGVPTYRRYDLLKLMLASVESGTVVPDYCVIVDNGGALVEAELPTTRMKIIVERPGKNLGVAGGWNSVMRHAEIRSEKPVHTLITNDDIVFGQKTIENMIALATDENVIVASYGESFSCFMIGLRLYARVGQFDEQFHPAYFEDNDYVRRMTLVGEQFTVAPHADGYHHARSATLQTYSSIELEQHHRNFEANRARYIAKWGGLPGHERFQKPGGP